MVGLAGQNTLTALSHIFPPLLDKLNDQSQVLLFLYAIWPKSKDLYPTYLEATQPPSDLRSHQVNINFTRLAYM